MSAVSLKASIPSPTTRVDYHNPNTGRFISVDPKWFQFFHILESVAINDTTSGPTASRPTDTLWVGRRYFDTTLGIPIWLKSVNPSVWVNASGTPV